MFRKLAIVVITAVAALLETLADAITATLPPPTADTPRLRVVAPGRLCLRLRVISPLQCQYRPHWRGHQPRPAPGQMRPSAEPRPTSTLRRAPPRPGSQTPDGKSYDPHFDLNWRIRRVAAPAPGRRSSSSRACRRWTPTPEAASPQPRAPEGWHWLLATTECHDLAGLRPPPGRSRTSRARALGTTSL